MNITLSKHAPGALCAESQPQRVGIDGRAGNFSARLNSHVSATGLGGTVALRPNRGSALVAALIMSAVIGIVVCSYLVLIADRNYLTHRSLAWNTGIPVLEAGIEEALTHLHSDSSLTANGWTSGGTNATVVYSKRRDFTNNSTYCLMTISNVTASSADVYSQGFVPSPSGSGYISRTVQVRTTNSAIFTKAIAAKGIIQFSGGSMVDSFNSANPLYSANGIYDPTKHEANGAVKGIG